MNLYIPHINNNNITYTYEYILLYLYGIYSFYIHLISFQILK